MPDVLVFLCSPLGACPALSVRVPEKLEASDNLSTNHKRFETVICGDKPYEHNNSSPGVPTIYHDTLHASNSHPGHCTFSCSLGEKRSGITLVPCLYWARVPQREDETHGAHMQLIPHGCQLNLCDLQLPTSEALVLHLLHTRRSGSRAYRITLSPQLPPGRPERAGLGTSGSWAAFYLATMRQPPKRS